MLLEEAKKLMGRLPFKGMDVLIIGEIGKNYSGAGMDPNVVGRMLIEATPEAETNDPRIVRIGVLDVSPESHGNATGIGIADLTTTRAIAGIDPVPFRMNNLTARSLWRSKLPFAFDTDREVIEACMETCWQPEADKVKFCVIPNTLEVVEMWVSAPLAADVKGHPHLEFVGEPHRAAVRRSRQLGAGEAVPAQRERPTWEEPHLSHSSVFTKSVRAANVLLQPT